MPFRPSWPNSGLGESGMTHLRRGVMSGLWLGVYNFTYRLRLTISITVSLPRVMCPCVTWLHRIPRDLASRGVTGCDHLCWRMTRVWVFPLYCTIVTLSFSMVPMASMCFLSYCVGRFPHALTRVCTMCLYKSHSAWGLIPQAICLAFIQSILACLCAAFYLSASKSI